MREVQDRPAQLAEILVGRVAARAVLVAAADRVVRLVQIHLLAVLRTQTAQVILPALVAVRQQSARMVRLAVTAVKVMRCQLLTLI